MATNLRARLDTGSGVVEVWLTHEDSGTFRVMSFRVVNTTARTAFGTGWRLGEPIIDGTIAPGTDTTRNVPGNKRFPEDEVGVTLTWPVS